MMMDDLPSEVLSKPAALVVFYGLDLKVQGHRTIWEAFNVAENSPLKLRLVNDDHQFPTAKPKKFSYERYIPRGILKSRWLTKHINEVPSVAVVFSSLELTSSDWERKRDELIYKVQRVRSCLKGRDTNICVVLLRSHPLPPGDDVVSHERAMVLCGLLMLPANQIFTLTLTDHLREYTLRMQTAFFELAKTYYQASIKRVKAHRDQVNETTHLHLFVRHPFKIGFYFECKQDLQSANKTYSQAYGNLMKVRETDSNLHEIKTVAGFINYKVCHVMFRSGTPLDAIAQFRRHIDLFKEKIGPAEVAWEHYAWLAKQYSIFGDLFDEAVSRGLSAHQNQHPGLYYESAAQLISTRKRLARQVCQNLGEYPNPDPLGGDNVVEYYGQRPWRAGRQSLEPPHPETEATAFLALNHLESAVSHGTIMINWLSNAIAQFNKYMCQRTKRHLMVLMAEEYYSLGDCNQALNLITHVAWAYRVEKWSRLLTFVLLAGLRYASLTARLQEYVGLAMELVGTKATTTSEDKNRIFENLIKILEENVPECEPGCNATLASTATQKWSVALSKPSAVTVDLSGTHACVQCAIQFSESSVPVQKPVCYTVYTRLMGPTMFPVKSLTVTMSNPVYNQSLDMSVEKLEPGVVYEQSGSLMVDPRDVAKKIEVTAIILHLNPWLSLRWVPGNSSTTATFSELPPEIPIYRFDGVKQHHLLDAHTVVQPSVMVTPRESRLELEVCHDETALVGEWCPVDVTIKNNETIDISNILLQVTPVNPSEAAGFTLTENAGASKDEVFQGANLGELKPSQQITHTFYIHPTQECIPNINLKVEYTVKVEHNGEAIACRCTDETERKLQVLRPWNVNMTALSLKNEVLEGGLYEKEPAVAVIKTLSNAHTPLTIISTNLNLNSEFEFEEDPTVSQLNDINVNRLETVCECLCVTPLHCTPPDQKASIGTYNILWTRKGCENGPKASSTITLPSYPVHACPVYVIVDMDPHGWVRTPLPLTYNLFSRASRPLHLKANVESSDAFMYSGYKQLTLCIPPHKTYQVRLNLYPLMAGHVALPSLHLTAEGAQGESLNPLLKKALQRLVPTHIYVMPQKKEAPEYICPET